jgi:hypothetical protein
MTARRLTSALLLRAESVRHYPTPAFCASGSMETAFLSHLEDLGRPMIGAMSFAKTTKR